MKIFHCFGSWHVRELLRASVERGLDSPGRVVAIRFIQRAHLRSALRTILCAAAREYLEHLRSEVGEEGEDEERGAALRDALSTKLQERHDVVSLTLFHLIVQDSSFSSAQGAASFWILAFVTIIW